MAEQAAREILRGHPGPAARPWLAWLSLACLIGFGLMSELVLGQAHLLAGLDLPVEHAIQGAPWGPVAWIFALINAIAGGWQLLFGLIVVAGMFVVDRRAGFLLGLGALASLFDQLVKQSVARGRPTADLVHVLSPVSGYSYPSGHAVFFTWLAFMTVAAISPRLRPSARVAAWCAALLVILLTCCARVWAGAHWPSDVAGGVLLATAWSAFVLWLPERWLPSPPWHRLALRRRNEVRDGS